MRFETELQNERIRKCWEKKNLPQEQNGNGSQHCPHTDQSVNLWALPRTPVASSHFLQHKKKRKKKPNKKTIIKLTTIFLLGMKSKPEVELDLHLIQYMNQSTQKNCNVL
jgi:hypothetical protein